MSATRLFLIVRIAGERVALPAERIDAAIECGQVTPVPRAPAHLLGVTTLSGRIVTVIDAAAALGIGDAPAAGEAVLIRLGGHAYALAVDMIEDVVDATAPASAPAGLAAAWRPVAVGAIEVDGAMMLVVDPERLLQAPAARAA